MDVATKVLPNVAPVVLDVEREVREQALTCLNVYVQRLQTASARIGMPVQPGQENGEEGIGDAPDLSKAADTVLASMSWLTSKVAAAVQERARRAPPARRAADRPARAAAARHLAV